MPSSHKQEADYPAADLYDAITELSQEQIKPTKRKHKFDNSCSVCGTRIKMTKRQRYLYDAGHTIICDICLIESEEESAYKYDPDVELELRLLKNPSGRTAPGLSEEE